MKTIVFLALFLIATVADSSDVFSHCFGPADNHLYAELKEKNTFNPSDHEFIKNLLYITYSCKPQDTSLLGTKSEIGVIVEATGATVATIILGFLVRWKGNLLGESIRYSRLRPNNDENVSLIENGTDNETSDRFSAIASEPLTWSSDTASGTLNRSQAAVKAAKNFFEKK